MELSDKTIERVLKGSAIALALIGGGITAVKAYKSRTSQRENTPESKASLKDVDLQVAPEVKRQMVHQRDGYPAKPAKHANPKKCKPSRR